MKTGKNHMYTVSATGMQQHITAKNYSQIYGNIDDAIKDFDRQCIRLEYDNVEINEDGSRQAGGIGYDYRIELTID